jgi:hypothetical protein
VPLFRLTLDKTYYRQGFFNVTVDFDRFIRSTEGPVELILGTSGLKIQGKVNRSAKLNKTSRIMGGSKACRLSGETESRSWPTTSLFTIFTRFTNWCYIEAVKRTTITIPRDLEAQLESYLKRQEVRPALTAVVQAALRQFLANRSYIPPSKPLRITPAKRGSGLTDVSINHDRYLAEPWAA